MINTINQEPIKAAEMSGFLWWKTIHDEIAEYMEENYLTAFKTKSEIVNLSKIILPIYQDAILIEMLPIYQVGDPDSISTLNYTLNMTGLDRQFVINYLAALEGAAKGGKIDYWHWNPTTEGIKAETETPGTPEERAEKEEREKSIIPFLSPAPAPEGVLQTITTTAERGFNKILVAGVVVALGYVVIKNILPRIRIA